MLHVREELAEGLSAHATDFLKFGEDKGRFSTIESIEDLLVCRGAWRLWRRWVFDHAKS